MLAVAACASAPEAGNVSDAPKASNIRALRWIAPGADKVKALSERPSICVQPMALSQKPVGQGVAPDVIGSIAFESSALLGGAAGRMGLSCSSCHLNGRGNPGFRLEGVSGETGTADVTQSLLSHTRGDGVFNPLPIPDLAARDGRQMRNRKTPEFRAKVHGLVVEEFDGQEPPPAIFDALLVFLDMLDMTKCRDPSATVPVIAMTDFMATIMGMMAADDYARSGDKPSAILMARMSREALERVHERFVAPDQADVREALVKASEAIGVWIDTVRAGKVGDPPSHLIDAAGALVLREEPRSLYNPDVLRVALAQSP
ncbi:MAG: hypothetical protein QM773_02935 [Hyphomonadaceae bacterium]